MTFLHDDPSDEVPSSTNRQGTAFPLTIRGAGGSAAVLTVAGESNEQRLSNGKSRQEWKPSTILQSSLKR
jgi:hypothetical protein